MLILGLANARKTTLLHNFSGEAIDKIELSLGFNIKMLEHTGYSVNFWDIGGRKVIWAYWWNYFEQNNGLLWVVDSSNRL